MQTAIAINQSPSLREKAILLVKLMQHVEKRFPDDTDLNAQFLDLVNYIYRSVITAVVALGAVQGGGKRVLCVIYRLVSTTV